MHRTISLLALTVLVVVWAPAFADTLTGKVVKITDGDTLYVLDANYKEHKIRLAGIDAPERKQAYGLASRKHLASIVADQQVTVEYQKRDRYGEQALPLCGRSSSPRPDSCDYKLCCRAT